MIRQIACPLLMLLAAFVFAENPKAKVVACGWDLGRATPQQILAVMPKLERTRLDGIAVKCCAVQDGIELDAGHIMNDPHWRIEAFADQMPVYRAINDSATLRENFLSVGMSARHGRELGDRAGRIALSDDEAWARIAANYGIAARIANECGFCGLLIDNEDYHGLKQFNYVPETDGEYDRAAATMRRRGREVFSAMFREFPKIRLGLFWAFSNIRTQLKADDPAAEIRASGRLFPQFLNGLLDVMPPEAVVIDFNEDAYTFRAADGTFDRTFVELKRDALVAVAPENRAKYRAQFRNSSLLYLDQYVGSKYRVRAGKHGQPNNWYRGPVNGSRDGAFFADLEAAVQAAEGYVGIYGERFGFVDWEHVLDAAMKPWNAFNSRITWDDELGLDAKLGLVKSPGEFLHSAVAVADADPCSVNILKALPSFGNLKPGIFIVSEQIENRNHFAVALETRGDVPVVARWQKGMAWNWEPHGVRKVELTSSETSQDGWTRRSALLRVPHGATRLQIQCGTNEVRNARLYRLDPPPRRPFRLAYQMDIARIGAPSIDELKKRIDAIAARGFDQFQLYMECEFAYRGHELVWRGRPVLDAGQVTELVRYAKRRGVEIVPSQNSFAHMNKWFTIPEYRERLAECPDGAVIDTPRIRKSRPSVTLVASAAASLEFLDGLYGQLFSCFDSSYVNIGCDEVYDLLDVNCRSAARVAKDGYARVYFDHVLDCRKLAYRRQKISMFWADAIFEHRELIRDITKDMIALVYGYTPGESDTWNERCSALADDEVRFYVCPGTQGWKIGKSAAERLKMARQNVAEAVAAAVRYGAEGLLLCDWGDGGYAQPLDYTVQVLDAAADLARPLLHGNRPLPCGRRIAE